MISYIVFTYKEYQIMKKARQYGSLSPYKALAVPLQEIHISTIGNWNQKFKGIKVDFIVITIIDPITNLVKIILIYRNTGLDVFTALKKSWFYYYPHPV